MRLLSTLLSSLPLEHLVLVLTQQQIQQLQMLELRFPQDQLISQADSIFVKL